MMTPSTTSTSRTGWKSWDCYVVVPVVLCCGLVGPRQFWHKSGRRWWFCSVLTESSQLQSYDTKDLPPISQDVPLEGDDHVPSRQARSPGLRGPGCREIRLGEGGLQMDEWRQELLQSRQVQWISVQQWRAISGDDGSPIIHRWNAGISTSAKLVTPGDHRNKIAQSISSNLICLYVDFLFIKLKTK